ncbi:MAG: YfiR family protein [Sphingomonas sp.]
MRSRRRSCPSSRATIALPATAQPGTGQPFYLCIIGRDHFGAMIDRAAASEMIDGHPVAVRRFANTEPGAVSGCQLAFVAGATEQQTGQMIEALRRQPTLTITDGRTGNARGMIHFAVIDGRVRFYIDEAAAAKCGIAISSRLLALAADVKQRGQ